MSIGCLEGVWYVSVGVWRLSEGCLECYYKVSGDRPSWDRTGPLKSGQVRSSQVKSGQVRSSQDSSTLDRSSQYR